jgi:hypothetical protein
MMMRLIDADNLKPDAQWDGFYNCYSAFSISQIDDAPTVQAVPIKALYDLRDELQKEADRQSLITASDLNIAINRIDAKIRQIEGSDKK